MRWIKRLFYRGRLEMELDKELSDHLERRIADLIADGMDRHAAMRQARLEFGGTEQVKETCRDARGIRWIEECVYDCRYALRTMSSNKAPGDSFTRSGDWCKHSDLQFSGCDSPANSPGFRSCVARDASLAYAAR